MSIHQSPPTKWVPLTNEIFDRLYLRYMLWIDDLTEIRERMAKLREAVKAGWKPDEISRRNLDRLNACDEHAAAKQMDNARTILLCAEWMARGFFPSERAAEIERAMDATMNEMKERSKPTAEQLASFDKRVDELRRIYRYGWRPFGNDPWVSHAAIELHYWCSSDRRPFAFRHWSATQIDLWLTYFEEQRSIAKSNHTLKLGLNLLGKKGLH